MAELLHGHGDEVGARLRVGDVGAVRQRLPARALDQCGSVGEPVHPAGAECHVGARLGERLGERHPQAAGGTGDDGDLAVESETVEDRGVGHASDSSEAQRDSR